MKKIIWISPLLLLWIGGHVAAEPLKLSITDAEFTALQYKFDEQKLGGFERIKVADGMRVRGWQVGKHTHFGQAKVNDKWGLGFVFRKGNTSYGVNHRGIQFNRKF